jgi:hypothetical protein
MKAGQPTGFFITLFTQSKCCRGFDHHQLYFRMMNRIIVRLAAMECLVYITVKCGRMVEKKEDVVMCAKHSLQMPVSIPQDIAVGCNEILNHMGQSILFAKPVISFRIFTYESGIQVDGVNKQASCMNHLIRKPWGYRARSLSANIPAKRLSIKA